MNLVPNPTPFLDFLEIFSFDEEDEIAPEVRLDDVITLWGQLEIEIED